MARTAITVTTPARRIGYRWMSSSSSAFPSPWCPEPAGCREVAVPERWRAEGRTDAARVAGAGPVARSEEGRWWGCTAASSRGAGTEGKRRPTLGSRTDGIYAIAFRWDCSTTD
jgi:hypothetical protein